MDMWDLFVYLGSGLGGIALGLLIFALVQAKFISPASSATARFAEGAVSYYRDERGVVRDALKRPRPNPPQWCPQCYGPLTYNQWGTDVVYPEWVCLQGINAIKRKLSGAFISAEAHYVFNMPPRVNGVEQINDFYAHIRRLHGPKLDIVVHDPEWGRIELPEGSKSPISAWNRLIAK